MQDITEFYLYLLDWDTLSSPLNFIKPAEVIQVTDKGILYSEESIGLWIDIPKGAIAKGLQLGLKVGMSLHGPFQYPAETSSIAPILMLCPDKDITLLKPIKVTLPHNIHQATKYSLETLGIHVVKANHSTGYVFEDISESKISLETREMKEYAVFSVTHFCFLSLRCDSSSKAARTKTCCIGPMYPSEFKFPCTYHLPITYYMDPWIEVNQLDTRTCSLSMIMTLLKDGLYKLFCIHDQYIGIKGSVLERRL